MAAFLKRLLNKSQVQALQKQTEELEEKDKALQAQADQLKDMTADRDKWMMQSEDLLVRLFLHLSHMLLRLKGPYESGYGSQ